GAATIAPTTTANVSTATNPPASTICDGQADRSGEVAGGRRAGRSRVGGRRAARGPHGVAHLQGVRRRGPHGGRAGRPRHPGAHPPRRGVPGVRAPRQQPADLVTARRAPRPHTPPPARGNRPTIDERPRPRPFPPCADPAPPRALKPG